MTIIYSTRTAKVHKNSVQNYSIHFDLIKNLHVETSTLLNLWNIFATSGYYFPFSKPVMNDDQQMIVTFNADSVVSLRSFLRNSQQTLKFNDASVFTSQIFPFFMNLEVINITAPFVSLDDFVVVKRNNQLFLVFIAIDNIFPIQNSNGVKEITFYSPIPVFDFGSPELLTIKKIPDKINYKSYLFSLASLISFCVSDKRNRHNTIENLKTNVFSMKRKELNKYFISLLSNIKFTKIYWSLIRCLTYKSEDRIFFYF